MGKNLLGLSIGFNSGEDFAVMSIGLTASSGLLPRVASSLVLSGELLHYTICTRSRND